MTAIIEQSDIRNNNLFDSSFFLIRRRPFKLIGKAFDIFDNNKNKLCYAETKMLKLKDEMYIFTDHSCSSELLKITGNRSLGTSSLYEVIDSIANQKIGSIKLLRLDEFSLLDKNNIEIGFVKSSNRFFSLK